MLQLIEKQKIYSDGKHNAFCDLIYYKKKYYLSFRNGTSHISPDGKICITSSNDLNEWSTPIIIQDKKDVRDTKLFIFKNKLFLMTFLEWKEEVLDLIIPAFCFTEDGENWSNFFTFFDVKWAPWRPKIKEKEIYNTFYEYEPKNKNLWRLILQKSKDGANWQYLSTIFTGDAVNETEIHFLKNNDLLAVLRREGEVSLLGKSKPPYSKWNFKEMKDVIHSPCIKQIGNKIILSGRKFNFIKKVINEKYEYDEEVALWEWNEKNFKKSLILEKDKNIDCGYPGIEKVIGRKNEFLVSYYFGNTRCADIYLARVKIC